MKLLNTQVYKGDKKYFLKVLFLSFIFFLPQIITLPQTKKINFERITIDDGLSQGSINCILQDNTGFMWFGTKDGLNRYDGYNFTLFKNNLLDSTSISSNFIECMTLDKNGTLWIGTSDGFNKYNADKENFNQYRINLPGISTRPEGNKVNSIASNPVVYDGILWLATAYGLVKFDIEKEKFSLYEIKGASSKNYANNILFDDEGFIWFSTNEEGIIKFDPRKETYIQLKVKTNRPVIISENHITRIYKRKNGKIIGHSPTGIFEIDTKTNKRTPFYFKGKPFGTENFPAVFQFFEDFDNKLYIGTYYGLYILSTKENDMQSYLSDQFDNTTISSNVISSIYMDRQGVLWLGTNGLGINKIAQFRNKFILYKSTPMGLSIQSIRGIYNDYKDRLWIGGYGNISYLDRKTNKYSKLKAVNNVSPDFYLNSYVFCEDKDFPGEALWIGSEGAGLNKLNLVNFQVENYIDYFPRDLGINTYFVNSILDDGKGNIWFGCEGGLVVFNKNDKKYKYYLNDPNDPKSIGPNYVLKIFQDRQGDIWIGTDYAGLNYYDKKNDGFFKYTSKPGDPKSLSNNSIRTIYEDSKGNLWIGTNGGGLNRFDRTTKTFESFNTKDGLPNGVVYGILEDEENNLWLSTNKGISKFNYLKKTFRNYSVHDGLQSNEFNSNAYYKNSKGELFFGGVNGFNSFYPSQVNDNQSIPRIVLTSFSIANKPIQIHGEYNGTEILKKSITVTDTVFLSYKDNVFTFEFAALDYSSPLRNRYSYKMDGFDKNWTSPSYARTATYTNLDPGVYTFRVKGSNNDGIWNEKGTSITLIITPPFWQTLWFRVILASMLIAAIYFFVVIRVKNIEKRSKELEEQVTLRTEELRTVNNNLLEEIRMRKNAEEKLMEYMHDLKESNASKDKFFSIISHDLKGPFQGLLGYSEIFLEDYDTLNDEERKQYASDINSFGKEIHNFLSNMLEWSRLETGKTKAEPVVINLGKKAEEIIRLLSASAVNKNIVLNKNIEPQILVYADDYMLSSILQNLLTNAIKFTPFKGVVNINANMLDDKVEVIVADTGVGMSNEVKNKLFVVGNHHTTKGTNNEGGTGLGLLLCKEMIEKNGGDIRVESELGRGTSFIFTLQAGK